MTLTLDPARYRQALAVLAAAWNEKDHNSPALVIESRLRQLA